MLGAGFGHGQHALFGSGVHEVDAGFSALSQPYNLPEGDILGKIVVNQVEITAVVVAFRDQLVFHIGDDVVFLGMDGHDPAVLRHFLKHGPQMPGGYLGKECCEYLEAGQPRLDSFANLPDGLGRNRSGQDVMEGEVDIGMPGEGLPTLIDLGHDGVGGRHSAWVQRQVAGEVYVGGDSAEGSGPAGRLRRLGEDFTLATGPVVGNRHVDVSVGFDTTR